MTIADEPPVKAHLRSVSRQHLMVQAFEVSQTNACASLAVLVQTLGAHIVSRLGRLESELYTSSIPATIVIFVSQQKSKYTSKP
jgi:hypothetical protein